MPLIIKTARATIPYVQPEMKFGTLPANFTTRRHWLNACLVRKIDFWRSVIQMRKKQQISTILNLSMPFYTLQQIFCLKENTATSIKQERTYLDLTCLVVSLSLHFWYRNMKENIKSSAYLHFHCKTYF